MRRTIKEGYLIDESEQIEKNKDPPLYNGRRVQNYSTRPYVVTCRRLRIKKVEFLARRPPSRPIFTLPLLNR